MKDHLEEKSAGSANNGVYANHSIDVVKKTLIEFLANEKKLVSQLYTLLNEQLALFDIGKRPNLSLMHEVIRFMENHPDIINHPIKLDVIDNIIRSKSKGSSQLQDLLADKALVESQRSFVKKQIEGLSDQYALLEEEGFRVLCKDFLEAIDSHLETESTLLLLSLKSSFDDKDYLNFYAKISSVDINTLSAIEIDDYPELFGQLSMSIESIESIDNAANNLAITDFVGVSNMLERVEHISEDSMEISSIIKEFSHKLYLENYHCYRELLMQSQENKRDYINKPLLCFKACYEEYRQGLDEMTKVFNVTKHERGNKHNK